MWVNRDDEGRAKERIEQKDEQMDPGKLHRKGKGEKKNRKEKKKSILRHQGRADFACMRCVGFACDEVSTTHTHTLSLSLSLSQAATPERKRACIGSLQGKGESDIGRDRTGEGVTDAVRCDDAVWNTVQDAFGRLNTAASASPYYE